MNETLRSECEQVVLRVESEIARFFTAYDGEPPIEHASGVQSVLLGTLGGKGVQITIHVQPDIDDPYWQT